EDDDVVGVPHSEHRHAGDGAVRVLGGGRVDGVVGADDEDDGGVVEVVVDLVHFQHDVVRHLGLGQQHVHVARQAPGDGVDAEPDVAAVSAQLGGRVGPPVLGLRHRHAVAGGDDHRVGAAEQFGGPLGGNLAVFAVVLVLGRAGLDAEAAGDDGD